MNKQEWLDFIVRDPMEALKLYKEQFGADYLRILVRYVSMETEMALDCSPRWPNQIKRWKVAANNLMDYVDTNIIIGMNEDYVEAV